MENEPKIPSAEAPIEEPKNTSETEAAEPVYLGTTKDGIKVYDRPDSHFHGEGGYTPEVLSKAIGAIETGGRGFIREKIEFDQPIGKTTCVEVGPDDEIVMVYRKGRSGMTPMVKNRDAQPCGSAVVIMAKNGDGDSYTLITSFIGDLATREPWDPGIGNDEERAECEEYWSKHALVYDESLIDKEKMENLKQMDELERGAEQIRPKVLFAGVFIDEEQIQAHVKPSLARPVKDTHVTTKFRPGTIDLHLPQVGTGVRVIAIGYGNDGQNEGLLVRVEADDPEVQAACDAIEVPHITISVAEGAQAKNTAYIQYEPLDEPFELTGKYGLFIQGDVVDSQEELAQRREAPRDSGEMAG